MDSSVYQNNNDHGLVSVKPKNLFFCQEWALQMRDDATEIHPLLLTSTFFLRPSSSLTRSLVHSRKGEGAPKTRLGRISQPKRYKGKERGEAHLNWQRILSQVKED